MKNTRIPLSIAYLDDEGVIQRIGDLQPFDKKSFRSQGPAMYALEMNQGWFKENQVGVGDRVEVSGLKAGSE